MLSVVQLCKIECYWVRLLYMSAFVCMWLTEITTCFTICLLVALKLREMLYYCQSLMTTSTWIRCVCMNLHRYVITSPAGGVQSIVMSMSVCVCVYISDLHEIFWMLPMALAWFSGVIVILYVLLVLWMTLCFFYNGPYSGMNFTTKDWFCLNLIIYRKVRQNSISYYKRA